MIKTSVRGVVAGVCFVAIVLASRSARAAGPVGVEVGAQVGFGTDPNARTFNPLNALGVGIGGRAGIVLFGGLYGGVKIIDYLGGTQTTSYGLNVSEHALQEGLDVGWGFKISLLTIRPQLGIGNITVSGTAFSPFVTPSGTLLGTNVGASTSSLYLEPGVTALVSLGLVYVGADVSYLGITGYPLGDGTTKTVGAVTAHGQVGVQF